MIKECNVWSLEANDTQAISFNQKQGYVGCPPLLLSADYLAVFLGIPLQRMCCVVLRDMIDYVTTFEQYTHFN